MRASPAVEANRSQFESRELHKQQPPKLSSVFAFLVIIAKMVPEYLRAFEMVDAREGSQIIIGAAEAGSPWFNTP